MIIRKTFWEKVKWFL